MMDGTGIRYETIAKNSERTPSYLNMKQEGRFAFNSKTTCALLLYCFIRLFFCLPSSLLAIRQLPEEIGQRFPGSFVVRPKTPGDIPETISATLAPTTNLTRKAWTHQRFLYSFVPFFSIVLINFPTARRPSFRTGSLWFLSSFFTPSSSFNLSRTGRNFF